MLLKGTVKTNPVRMVNARAIVVSTNAKRPRGNSLKTFKSVDELFSPL